MDFSNTLPRKREKNLYSDGQDANDKDPGSEIVAALFPLVRAHFTNVTWIVLNDVELGDTDLDDLSKIPLQNFQN